MALTDSQVSSLLDEVVKMIGFIGKDTGTNEVRKTYMDKLIKWNSILQDNSSMQLLGLTLANAYAEQDKHKNTTYVIDKTMQLGMLVGYLLKQKEDEVEALEKLHG